MISGSLATGRPVSAMKSEIDLETMLYSWPHARGTTRKHLARQLREETIGYLQTGAPLPRVLADWLVTALEEKDIDLFAEPWEEFVPTAENQRAMEMAIMARILKNRPDIWQQQGEQARGFLDAAAELFAATARKVRDAYEEHREVLDGLEELMGLRHLPTKSDILAFRDAELARVADAVEESLRTRQQVLDRLCACLGLDTDRATTGSNGEP